jgi:hypothetical protein
MSDSKRDARLTALEAAVAELRAQLAHARRPQIRSMRVTHRCPACNGGRLLHFRTIKDVTHGAVMNLSLQKDYSAWWGVKLSAGTLEAYACCGCRLVEWSAVTLDDIKPDGTDVVEITAPAEREPDTGPYR